MVFFLCKTVSFLLGEIFTHIHFRLIEKFCARHYEFTHNNENKTFRISSHTQYCQAQARLGLQLPEGDTCVCLPCLVYAAKAHGIRIFLGLFLGLIIFQHSSLSICCHSFSLSISNIESIQQEEEKPHCAPWEYTCKYNTSICLPSTARLEPRIV